MTPARKAAANSAAQAANKKSSTVSKSTSKSTSKTASNSRGRSPAPGTAAAASLEYALERSRLRKMTPEQRIAEARAAREAEAREAAQAQQMEPEAAQRTSRAAATNRRRSSSRGRNSRRDTTTTRRSNSSNTNTSNTTTSSSSNNSNRKVSSGWIPHASMYALALIVLVVGVMMVWVPNTTSSPTMLQPTGNQPPKDVTGDWAPYGREDETKPKSCPPRGNCVAGHLESCQEPALLRVADDATSCVLLDTVKAAIAATAQVVEKKTVAWAWGQAADQEVVYDAASQHPLFSYEGIALELATPFDPNLLEAAVAADSDDVLLVRRHAKTHELLVGLHPDRFLGIPDKCLEREWLQHLDQRVMILADQVLAVVVVAALMAALGARGW